jgi:hypothetical protein
MFEPSGKSLKGKRAMLWSCDFSKSSYHQQADGKNRGVDGFIYLFIYISPPYKYNIIFEWYQGSWSYLGLTCRSLPPWLGPSLRSCWGLFVQNCEFFSRQWNCIFTPSDVLTVFFFPSNFARWAYILPWNFRARKLQSFVGSRTRVLSFCSPKFFHCASRPQHDG